MGRRRTSPTTGTSLPSAIPACPSTSAPACASSGPRPTSKSLSRFVTTQAEGAIIAHPPPLSFVQQHEQIDKMSLKLHPCFPHLSARMALSILAFLWNVGVAGARRSGKSGNVNMKAVFNLYTVRLWNEPLRGPEFSSRPTEQIQEENRDVQPGFARTEFFPSTKTLPCWRFERPASTCGILFSLSHTIHSNLVNCFLVGAP